MLKCSTLQQYGERMSLEPASVIDAIGDDKGSNSVTLTIIDGWDWADETKHLYALQAKINAYFDFIQGGQLFELRPAARGKTLRIRYMTKFLLPEKARQLLVIAGQAAATLNLEVVHEVFPSKVLPSKH